MQILRHIYILCIITILGGCGAGQQDTRDAIAVSFEPQAWMVKQIAGDDIDIVTLLPAGSDPEVYQPSISTMKILGNAKAYLTLGTSGFEQSITDNISKNFPDLKIIDSGKGVEKIYGLHGNPESNDMATTTEFDPHLLTSIRNCKIIVRNITETMVELYPEKAKEYLEAGTALFEKLAALDDSITGMRLKGKSFTIRHPSLSYYARDYGIEQIALSEVGKETSPLQLKQQIDASAMSRPAVMIVEKEHATSSDYATSRQLGTDTIQVSLNTAGWLNDLIRISNEINRD